MFRRKLYSQNFLQSRTLLNYLVRRSSIGQIDLVLDLGMGAGIITSALLGAGASVIGVEIDPHFASLCKRQFQGNKRVLIIQGDILNLRLPKGQYKVFSNIPFSIEGKIIRKLLTANNPPEDCYLVIRKDLATRLVGERQTTLFSVLYQPFFNFSIEYAFRRTDFWPVPSMDCVLFRFVQKDADLIDFSQRKNYWLFVQSGFGNGGSVYKNLMRRYGAQKIEQTFQRFSINKKAKPTQISGEIWQKMFLTLIAG